MCDDPPAGGLDAASLETLFPEVAGLLDAVPEERRLLVITKAFVLLAHRCGDRDTALACLDAAKDNPRRG